MDNILSQAGDKFKSLVPSPLAGAGYMLAAGIPLAYLLRPAAGNTARTLLRPLARVGGMTEQEYEEGMDDMAKNKKLNAMWTLGLPMIPAAAYLATQYRHNAPYGGMTGWTNPFSKTQSLSKTASLWEATNYQPLTDFGHLINVRDVSQLFQNDPYLKANSDYAAHLGTAIVNAAPAYGNQTTLGNVFDSAVDKIKKKLTFEGIAQTAVKTVLANTAAHMLTGAIGAITTVNPKVRQSVISAGTWGAAIQSILK